jgi:hypothetical protein
VPKLKSILVTELEKDPLLDRYIEELEARDALASALLQVEEILSHLINANNGTRVLIIDATGNPKSELRIQ